jgi:hypothetical protein
VSDTNGKVPPWLAALGIEPGEYFTGSKLKLQRGMKARCFSESARIWCCLGLHTEGFQQELAVKVVAGKRVPLQPIDVATKTGIKKQNIRRGMLDLRAWGMGDIEGDEHHDVSLYAWVKPRPVIAEEVIERDYFAHVPDEWRSLFRRFKVRPAEDFEFARDYLDEVEAAARDYAKAGEVLKSVLGRSRARDPIQRNERNTERNNNSSGADGNGGSPVVVDSPALKQLTKRGIAEAQAKKLLRSLPADQPVLDQLEYGDHLIAKSRGKIANAPGFYVYLLRERVLPPAEFETSERRQARHQAEQQQAEETRERILLEDEYHAYCRDKIQAHFRSLSKAEQQELKDAKIRSVRRQWGHLPAATIEELAQRQIENELREKLDLPTVEEFASSRVQKAGGSR